MQRRARLAAQIQSLNEFGDLIRAMRAIAGSHVQEARDFLPGIRGYTSQIERGLVNAIRFHPQIDNRDEDAIFADELVIAVCSEHGLSGAYSEKILEKAAALAENATVFGIVGRRGKLLAEERKIGVDWTTSMVTHTASIPGLCADIMDRITNIASVTIVSAQYQPGGRFDVAEQKLAPIDPILFERTDSAALPIHQIEPDILLSELTQEYVYSQLMHTLMEAFASENGARLNLMEAADRSIQEKLHTLSKRERNMQQEEVTSELLDIVTGAEAVMRHT